MGPPAGLPSLGSVGLRVRLGGTLCALVMTFAIFLSPAFAARSREIVVRNVGTKPIFWLQVAPQHTQSWGRDLLTFNDALDVGEARTLSVALPAGCLYDVRAVYRDRSTAQLSSIDLCRVSEVAFSQ